MKGFLKKKSIEASRDKHHRIRKRLFRVNQIRFKRLVFTVHLLLWLPAISVSKARNFD